MDKRPLKVFLCHAHSDATAVRAFGGRVGGVLPPYRDHNRLVKKMAWTHGSIKKSFVVSEAEPFCPDKIGNMKFVSSWCNYGGEKIT